MRFRSLIALTAVAFVATACRSAGNEASTAAAPMAAPAAPMVNAAGRWSLLIDAQGQALELLVELRKVSDTEFAGSMSSQAFPTVSVSKATLTGNRLMLQVPAPTGDVATFNLVIEGDVMTGDWSMPGMGSRVNGKRIP